MKKFRRAKPLPNGRSGAPLRHVRLYDWMLKSAAYRHLSCCARALLVELYSLYWGGNNGEIFMSARSAGERLGVGKTKGSEALHELADHGFIRARQKGTFSLKMRHATTWVLTEFEFCGEFGTKDFLRWAPGEKQKPVRKRGHTAPASGQKTPAVPFLEHDCPYSGTDISKSVSQRSATTDTVSLPGGVSALPALREQASGDKRERAISDDEDKQPELIGNPLASIVARLEEKLAK